VSHAFELSDRLVEDLAALLPTAATRVGITSYDDRWEDLGLAGHAEVEATLARYRAEFGRLWPSDNAWAEHAAAAAIEFLDRGLDRFDAGEHLRDLNSIHSPVQTLRQVFDVMDMRSAAGWENIVRRLETLPKAITRYRESLDEGRRLGVTAARRQVLACARECRVNAGERSFFHELEGSFRASGVEPDGLADRLQAASPDACGAYGALADYLERTYLPDAVPEDGVGRDRYERSASWFLGRSIDPAETYAWGWDQVRELSEQMRETAREIDDGKTLREVIDLLETDPDRCAASPDEFVEAMQARQDWAVSELAGVHFDVPDVFRTVTVNLAPPGGALGAYYIPPSEDSSRPGSVWYSVGDRRVFPLYREVSTAYHEGFPGHHLQHAIVMSLGERVSRLQRTFAWTSGSGEGWALYAERLMGELGFFERPDYLLGMLASHMFRACRIVIDIGSHLGLRIPRDAPLHPGESWTFENAVELLVDYAFEASDVARSEVTRYLGWPGQAISYKVGERAILELRDEVGRRRGGKPDLKDFHARVLEAGSVGLDLLRGFVLDRSEVSRRP
jgi:uncharacterized protein (DUF885 family)